MSTENENKGYGVAIAVGISCILVVVALIVVIVMLVNSGQQLKKSIYPKEYSEYVYKYSQEYNLDPNLVFAIIKTESNFNPDAGSNAGALGLMQLMPDTFDWLQQYKNGEVTMDTSQLYDPETNIQYGCIFLEFLLEKYSVEETAVAAYNAGFGAVDGWLEDSNYSTDGETLYYIPYPETATYVEKVEVAKSCYESNTEPAINSDAITNENPAYEEITEP